MSPLRPLPEFTAHCLDLLASVGPCQAKRMFGGWGISVDGITFAIIADLGSGERLWLKTDDHTLPRFQAEGCPRFVYQAKGRNVAGIVTDLPYDLGQTLATMGALAKLGEQTPPFVTVSADAVTRDHSSRSIAVRSVQGSVPGRWRQ